MIELEFMRNAFLAGLLVAIVCGVVGTFVVVNRLVGLAGGIAHSTYGGIGLALFFGFPYFVGVMGFGILGAAVMGWITWKDRERADALIGVLWAAGMALGVLLVDLSPGYGANLMALLFGSILAVSQQMLLVMALLLALVIVVVWYWYPQFLALSHDPEFAHVRGIPVAKLYMVLIALIALGVVLAVQAVGMILVIALLTIPTKIAAAHTSRLGSTMVLASAIAVVFTWGGILLSWYLNWNAGAAIILLGSISFGLHSLIISKK